MRSFPSVIVQPKIVSFLLYLLLIPGLALDFLVAESTKAAPSSTDDAHQVRGPNIIFMLTDDQGYGDFSVHGNPILKTPHLDRLHAESVRFTDFHVGPTCAPTRAALLTGCHEFKSGVTHTIMERERLALDKTTLPQILKSSGYATGIFGKWHLGDEAKYQPNQRGFDEVFIHGGGGIGQTYPGSCGDAPGNSYFNPAILHNGKFEKTKGFCTDIFFNQALQWIDSQRKSGKPFYAYLAPNAPHGPYIAKPEDSARYSDKGLPAATQNFFGMIHNIDENVGKLMSRLKDWGIAENTLVVFMNDNGGTAGVKVYNAGMRGSKCTPYLGGTRAASFWRWPGTLKPADCTAFTGHIDFFPTIVEITKSKLSEQAMAQVEGRSLLPLLKNPTVKSEDRFMMTHTARWPKLADPKKYKYKSAAVRNTRWAMVSEKGGSEPQWQLYDLSNDYSQKINVIEQHPEVVQQLADAFDRWWADCLPKMINEKEMGPEINPFQKLYYAQFGGQPSEDDFKLMDPKGSLIFATPEDKLNANIRSQREQAMEK